MPGTETPDPLYAKARRRWARTDPTLAAVAKAVPAPVRALDSTEGFESLVSSITHQQVSLAAGRTIYGRVLEAVGGGMTAEAVLKTGPDPLRAAGLSRSKVQYVLDLADRTMTGALDFAALRDAPDDEVIETLTAVKGIGVWTAKMHLIFHLRRPDILPFEDLGVQLAVARAYDVDKSEAVATIKERASAWSPYSSYAALTLWNWRHVVEAADKAKGK